MPNVFAKVFSQIFDSTIAEDYKVRHMFMDLLVMADSDGVVDKTPQAIARIANVPLEEVQAALFILSQPDPASRTKEHDGRRIQLVDESRDWGWRIINFQKYRDIRDEEARRIANRSYKRQERAKKRQQMSASCPDNQHSQPPSAHIEVEVETEAEVLKSKPSPTAIEEIYDLYPKKVGKRTALKAIGAAIKRVMDGEYKNVKRTEAEAIAGIKGRTALFADSEAGSRGQYTPHPATWFNRSGYLDDPKEWNCEEPEPVQTRRTKSEQRVSANREAILAGLGISREDGRSESDLQDGHATGRDPRMEKLLRG